jgi:predicted transposase YdaD
MAGKPFDVTAKDLIEDYAAIWPLLAGPWPCRTVDVIDADVSTVTGAADKVLLVHGPEFDSILNLEVQSGHTLGLPARLHLNSTLLERRHDLLVRSAVVLLRRQAQASNMTGLWELCFPDEQVPYDSFRFRVVRIWELPLEPLLIGALGFLPLAPLTDEAAAQLPTVIGRLEERIRREAGLEEADKLRTSAFILMGLRYSEELIDSLFEGVSTMEESVTYQAIIRKGIEKGIEQGLEKGTAKGLAQGMLKEAKGILLLLGEKRFGPPDPAARSAIEALTDREKVEYLTQRLLEVESWHALLDAQP